MGIFENFGNIAVGSLIVGMILVVGFVILDQTQSQNVTFISSSSYSNETRTLTNGTTTTFDNCINDIDMVVSAVYNDTGHNSVLDSGNYTVSKNTVAINTYDYPAAASKNITYSCKNRDSAYNATKEMVNANSTIPTWVPLIIICMIGAALVMLVRNFNQ